MTSSLRWLGDCRDHNLNLLRVFGLDANDYNVFVPEQTITEEKRLFADIKKRYRALSIVLHPDKLNDLPIQLRETGEELFKEITDAYTLLTDESKYPPPLGYTTHDKNLATYFGLAQYVQYIQDPDKEHPLGDPYFTHTLVFFLKVREGLEQIKQDIKESYSRELLEKDMELTVKQKTIDGLQEQIQKLETNYRNARSLLTQSMDDRSEAKDKLAASEQLLTNLEQTLVGYLKK